MNHESTSQRPINPETQTAVHPEDLGILHEQHFPRIARYIGNIINNPDAAPDLAQDTFEKAFRVLGDQHRPDGPEPISPKGVLGWLLRIASNKAKDYLRGENRKYTESVDAYTDCDEQTTHFHGNWGGLQSVFTDPRADVEETVARNITLQNIFSTLPSKMAQTLYLACYKGYSYAEIAKLMEEKEATIKTRIHRARLLIGEISDKDEESPW